MHLDDRVRLQHMLDAAQTARSFAAGENRQSLNGDQKLVFALVRAIEIIGEATSKVTDDSRKQYSQIPWSQIIGMRNRIIHAYFDVDLDQVWSTVGDDLPPLIEELGSILAENQIDSENNGTV